MKDVVSPESEGEKEDFSREVYRLLLFYKQLTQIIESFAHGYLMIGSDEIDMDYLRLCSKIEEILEKPGFESLAQLAWRPFENLRDPDIDVYWEYLGPQLCGSFLTAVEEAFISVGERTYSLDTDDQRLLSQIQTRLKEYISYKKDYEAKWVETTRKRAREWLGEHREQSTSDHTQRLGSDVFIVHGHDEAAKQSVARFIETLGLRPVILQERPSAGRTIIEKLEHYSNVGFVVVIMTPDDIGAPKHKLEEMKDRARQNVIFELGYFASRLGRNRVCILTAGVEIPSDLQGVVYVDLDPNDEWQSKLAREIEHAGIEFDTRKLPSYTLATGPVSNLTKVDSLVLKLSCEKAIKDGQRHIGVSDILPLAKFQDISEEQFLETLEVLDKRGYIESKYEIGRLAPLYFTVTVYGFEQYARAYIKDYDSIVRSVASQIANCNKRSIEPISTALNQPTMVVNHILEVLESKDLISVARFSGGEIHIDYISPELKRMLRET